MSLVAMMLTLAFLFCKKVLQKPFNDAMERYLAVKQIRPQQAVATSRSWAWEIKERASRTSHPSSIAEASEEEMWNARQTGKSHGPDRTSFNGILETFNDQRAQTSPEQSVWEFRGHDVDPVSSLPNGSDPLDVPLNRVYTPKEIEAKKAAKKAAKEARAEQFGYRLVDESTIKSEPRSVLVNSNKAGKNERIFRFTNVSSEAQYDGKRNPDDVLMTNAAYGKRQFDHRQNPAKVKRRQRVEKAIRDLKEYQKS